MFLSRHLPWKHSKIKWLVVDWVRFSFRVTGIDRPSDDTENCLAPDSSTSKGSLLSDLRPALNLCHAATRLSAGDVADEWVTQLLRQGDSQVFRKYSQMKLQMKREALEKWERNAFGIGYSHSRATAFWYSFGTVGPKNEEK
jgi:hypothetical protein